MTTVKPEITPKDAGLSSEAPAVGKRLAALLDALEAVNGNIASGQLIDELQQLRTDLIFRLREAGWIVSVNRKTDNWQVKPERDYWTTASNPRCCRACRTPIDNQSAVSSVYCSAECRNSDRDYTG